MHRIESERERKRGCSPKHLGAHEAWCARGGSGVRRACGGKLPEPPPRRRGGSSCRGEMSDLKPGVYPWGPCGPKWAKDGQGLQEAKLRTQSLARSGSKQARLGWGSFVKAGRCSRWRRLRVILLVFCLSLCLVLLFGKRGPVKSRDGRSRGGFLTSAFGNSEKSGWGRQRRLPRCPLPRRGPGAPPRPRPHLAGRGPLESGEWLLGLRSRRKLGASPPAPRSYNRGTGFCRDQPSWEGGCKVQATWGRTQVC